MSLRKGHKVSVQQYFVLSPKVFIYSVFFPLLLMSLPTVAQETQMVQIKTFDQQLKPYQNINIAINGQEFISMGEKGVAFVELNTSELPVKSIQVENKLLEVASWNHSKGTLEIIIRKKSYRLTQLIVRNDDNEVISNEKIIFNGKKIIEAITNAEGRVELPLALDEKINSPEQFTIEDHRVINLHMTKGENELIVRRINNKPKLVEKVADNQESNEPITQDYFKNFALSNLDSIQSLTVFYAVFKNYHIEDLDEETKRLVDAKFNELVGQLQDSIRNNTREISFIGRISDSTYMREDIGNLLSQARLERQMLIVQQRAFEQKINLINDKLATGFENLDSGAREKLLSDLNLLEIILTENESNFYKNQNNYRQIIASLKERFFDLEALENQLSASEAQRLEEQRIFRQRLLATLSVVALFAILIILLIYFSNKLKKQKEALELANAEIKRINENLENIVAERTQMLAETNKELDTVLYRASHDLRAPVRSIIGLCNIAATLSNGESKEVLEKVVQTTTGMDKLLKKLSVISEINEPSNFSPIPLAEMVERIQDDFNEIIQDSKIAFVIDCPVDLVIHSYPNLIEVILMNLIENALFYCMIKGSGNAQVQLKATVKGEHLELILTDNGIGVEDTISDKLFDMFFRGTEKSQGNGLGLYIVQKSVHALKGSITVLSEPGQYSSFVVHLPLNDVQLQGSGVDKLKSLEV